MQGKKVVGKGLAKVEKLGMFKSGVSGSKKQVPGKVVKTASVSTKPQYSKVKQPVQFSNPTSMSGFTKFVS